MKIERITSRKILDSAGKYTLEATVQLAGGIKGVAAIPGGISRGTQEAVPVEVDQAIKNISELEYDFLHTEYFTQEEFDKHLIEKDGSFNKATLGANTLLSLSIAFCKATAASLRFEPYEYIARVLHRDTAQLRDFHPKMMMLMCEGGVHGSAKAGIQEFMVIVDSIDRGIELYQKVRETLVGKGYSANVGAEGAFSPHEYDNEEILDLLASHLNTGELLAIDVAASSYPEHAKKPKLDHLLDKYPIGSIEDPFTENEWDLWVDLTEKRGKEIQIVTDDLTTTHPDILNTAITRKAGNAIIIKPNQVGTITETLQVISLAHQNNWKTIISHRGTDTNDDFIADLAIGSGSEYTKFGAPARGERVAKYNRLMQIFNNK